MKNLSLSDWHAARRRWDCRGGTRGIKVDDGLTLTVMPDIRTANISFASAAGCVAEC